MGDKPMMMRDTAFLQSLHEQLGQTLREFSAVKAALGSPKIESRQQEGFISARTLPKKGLAALGGANATISAHAPPRKSSQAIKNTSSPEPHQFESSSFRQAQQKTIPELLAATERLADAAQDVVRLARQCAEASAAPPGGTPVQDFSRGSPRPSYKAQHMNTPAGSGPAALPSSPLASSRVQHPRPTTAARVPLLALADPNSTAVRGRSTMYSPDAKAQTRPQPQAHRGLAKTLASPRTTAAAAPRPSLAVAHYTAGADQQSRPRLAAVRPNQSPPSARPAAALSAPKPHLRPTSAASLQLRLQRKSTSGMRAAQSSGPSALTAPMAPPQGTAAEDPPSQQQSAFPHSMSAQPSQTAPEPQQVEAQESTAELLQQISHVRLPSGLGPEAAEEPITPTSMHQLLRHIDSEVQGLSRSARPSADRAGSLGQPAQAAQQPVEDADAPRVPGPQTAHAATTRQSGLFMAEQLQCPPCAYQQHADASNDAAASADSPLASLEEPMSVHELVQRIESEVQGGSASARASADSAPQRVTGEPLTPAAVHQLLQRIDSEVLTSSRPARASAGRPSRSFKAPTQAERGPPAPEAGCFDTRPGPSAPQAAVLQAPGSEQSASAEPSSVHSPSPAAEVASSGVLETAEQAPDQAVPGDPSAAESAASHSPAKASPAASPAGAQAGSPAAASAQQLLREIGQELQLDMQVPEASTSQASAAPSVASQPRESTEQLLQRINSALQGETSGSAAEPAVPAEHPQDNGSRSAVRLHLPSEAARLSMAAAAATESQSASQHIHSEALDGVMNAALGSYDNQEHSSPSSPAAHATSTADNAQPPEGSDIEDVAADASAGSAVTNSTGPDRDTVRPSDQASRLERRGTYMSPLLLAVATQDAAEPEQRQHDEPRGQAAVPAAFRMASDQLEEQGADATAPKGQVAPSSAASVDFEDGFDRGAESSDDSL